MPPTSVHKATLDSFARAEYWSQQEAPTERRSNSRFLYIDGLTYLCHVVLLERFVVPPGIDRFASIHCFLCMWISRLKREYFYALCRVCCLIITELYVGERGGKFGVVSWKTATSTIFIFTFKSVIKIRSEASVMKLFQLGIQCAMTRTRQGWIWNPWLITVPRNVGNQ